MNNFELHEQSQFLSDTQSSYHLAKLLVQSTELLDELVKDLYVNNSSKTDWDVVERCQDFLENVSK